MIELASPSDHAPRGKTALGRKLAAHLANGDRLGWLLLPEQRAVEVWRAGDPAAELLQGRLEPAETLNGGEAFPGLLLELAELWAV